MKYLEITEDNHKQSLDELNKHAKNGGESVVALTAPWCGHCKALKPELNKMRSKLKGGNGIVANVSDKYHSQLDMDTNVDGFPTIRHFKGGKKVRDYEGKRAAEEIANFANNSLNSAVQKGGSLIGVGAYEYQQEQQAIENGTALYIPGQKLFYANQYNEYKAFLNDPGYTSGETKEEPEVGVVLTKQLVRSYFDNLIGKSIYLVKNGTEPSNRWKIKVLKLAMPKERVSWLEKDLNIKYSQSDGGIIKYLTQVAAPEATGGGKRRTRRKSKKNKTRRRKKRGGGGAVVSKPIGNNTSKKNNGGMIVGGIEIGNNTARNDIEYVTLYNIILGRLQEYSNSGLGSNDASYSVNNDWSVPRAIKELKQNRARTRELILDIATLISSYNLDLRDNEVLAIAFALYIALVGGEQYDDGTDIQRMLGLLAYGKDYYDGNKFRHGKPVQPRLLSKKLKKIFIEITATGDKGSLQSQIRRKMMGLNNPRSIKNSSTRGASKTRIGGRRKKRRKTRNKRKRNKKRRNTKKRGGGLCASRQQPACEDMSAIMTRIFSPQNIRSTQQADANAPSLIMKIGQCSVCFKIGEGWLRQNTSAALAVALWLDALTKHKWIPYGKNLAERNGNVFLLVARLAKEMNKVIKTVQNA